MTNVMNKFFSKCLFLFTTLYMFPAHSAHHQERILPSQSSSNLHTSRPPTQKDCYQRLYWYNFYLLMMSTVCSKHVES